MKWFWAGWLLLEAATGLAAPPPLETEPLRLSSAFRESAAFSVHVERASDGAVVYSHQADTPLNVASNVKLLLSAALLEQLGPWHTLPTRVWGEVESSGQARWLCVEGSGDPALEVDDLSGWARQLVHRGVTEVAGDLVLDTSAFDATPFPPGFEAHRGVDQPYAAPTGALSVNRNVVAVRVRRGARGRLLVSVEPQSAYVELAEERLRARCGRRKLRVHARGMNDRLRVEVEGCLRRGQTEAVRYRRVTQPTRFFGETLRDVLALHGIRVRGALREGACPSRGELLLEHVSPPLGQLVRTMNKHSSNFFAEQLLKVLGAARSGGPGSTATGLEATAAYLASLGIAPDAYRLENGSGLSEASRLTTRQLVRVLRHVAQSEVSPEFLASLPIAGRDGTLLGRFGRTGMTARVRAKTGTLAGVRALSGYLTSEAGERYAFSLVANRGAARRAVRWSDIDRAVEAVSRSPAAPAAPLVGAPRRGLLAALEKTPALFGVRPPAPHRQLAALLGAMERLRGAMEEADLGPDDLDALLEGAAQRDAELQMCAAALAQRAGLSGPGKDEALDASLWALEALSEGSCAPSVERAGLVSPAAARRGG